MHIHTNIAKIFKNPLYICAYIIFIGILGVLWYNFTDFDLMKGNYGEVRYYIDGIISWANILLFPLFIVAWIYRSYTLWGIQKKESIGFFGGLIGTLISGSLCCGSSLLLAVGASTFTNFFSKMLPYGWLELKIIGLIILLYALFSLLNNLLACNITKQKISSK